MDIYLINVEENNNILKEKLLEFKKKEISNPKKLIEHCISYYYADKILNDVYNIESREIIFVNGKPYLKSNEKFLSISHSGKFAAIVFSDCECGIDIEKMKQRNFSKISKRMGFNSTEQNEFYKEWTRYEAEYKLGLKIKAIKYFQVEDYAITAVSANPDEKFQIYFEI